MEEAGMQKKLVSLIHEIDADGSGTVSLEELTEALEKPLVAQKFEMLGITIRDVRRFFSTLTVLSKDVEVSVEDFTRGCLRMRGHASAMDMQTVQFQVSEVSKTLRQLRQLVGS